MALENYKCVFFFGGLKWGWTETLYATIDSGGFDGMTDAAKRLVASRLLFLHMQYSLEAVRLEQVDAAGNSFTTARSVIAYTSAGCGPGKATGECADPWQCLLFRSYETNRDYARNFMIRGTPNNWRCIDDKYLVPPKLGDDPAKAMQPWISKVTSGMWSMRVINRSTGRNDPTKVSSITVDPVDGFFIVTPDSALAAQVGDKIHVHGATQYFLRGVNGQHTVLAHAGLGFKIDAKPRHPTCTGVYNNKAVCWDVETILVPIATMDFSRVVVKKTGRPFFGTRGRRRVG